ncbi:MAG: membrane protein [Cyclobacteriaceae bacterium]|nr:MAG: membrane protein [Cyclobacteriaceae bacterium]
MKYVLPLFIVLSTAACQPEHSSDAYGNFEATEVIISAEANGRLIDFFVQEGEEVHPGVKLGVIDTTQLHLEKQQLIYSIAALKSKIQDVKVQVNVLREQKENLLREQIRLENLFKDNAATEKQLDDINGEIQVVDSRILATRSQMNTSNLGILSEIAPLEVRVAQINDQLKKSYVTSPIAGIVLVQYAENGEFASVGKPLFKVADMKHMEIRVYVSGDQLGDIRIGQPVQVLVDNDRKSNRTLAGKVSWVSSQAEFTPKIIQTKKERVNLVYAVKVASINDGTLKIGMPGEVEFNHNKDD